MASAKQPYESMWVAVVQLWPADMAKRLLWCALWRTQPMETQGFRGNLPGLCWTVAMQWPSSPGSRRAVRRLQKKSRLGF